MASTSADDAELWRDWQVGDARAFERIVRRHTPRLLALATRLMLYGRAQLSTWLHRITINAALARLRRGARRREVPMEQAIAPVEEGGQGEPPDDAGAEAKRQGEVKGAAPVTSPSRSEAVAISVVGVLRALPR
jgi:RNA polymerase sigma-70 factor (ECF subfamily)